MLPHRVKVQHSLNTLQVEKSWNPHPEKRICDLHEAHYCAYNNGTSSYAYKRAVSQTSNSIICIKHFGVVIHAISVQQVYQATDSLNGATMRRFPSEFVCVIFGLTTVKRFSFCTMRATLLHWNSLMTPQQAKASVSSVDSSWKQLGKRTLLRNAVEEETHEICRQLEYNTVR